MNSLIRIAGGRATTLGTMATCVLFSNAILIRDGAGQENEPVMESSLRAGGSSANAIYNGSPWLRVEVPEKTFNFDVNSSVEYNDNVFIDPDNEQSDVVWTISPRFKLNLGDFRDRKLSFLRVAYTANASVYMEGVADDALDHLVQIDGSYRLKRLAFPITAQVSRQNAAFSEVGGRELLTEYQAGLGADYRLSSKTSVGLLNTYSRSDYENFSDFYTWTTEAYFTYRMSTKTDYGVAVQNGFSRSSGSSKQSFQTVLLRAHTQPTGKIALNAEAGGSHRSFDDGDRQDFVFRVGAGYQPTAKQQWTIEAYRELANSGYSADSSYTSTGVRMGYSQGLGKRALFDLSLGYRLESYFGTEETADIDREDEFLYLSAGLRYRMGRHWEAELFYFVGENDSSEDSLSFDNQRLGLGLTWIY